MKPTISKAVTSLGTLSLMGLLHLQAHCQQPAAASVTNAVVAHLVALGDSASVEEVMREAAKAPGISGYDRLRLIEMSGTTAARQALLETALGRCPQIRNVGAAADCYIRLLPDKRLATNLLHAADSGVIFSALSVSGLAGCKVDDDLMSQLKPLLESQNVLIRSDVLRVLQLSPAHISESSIKAVVDSMRSVEALPDAANTVAVQVGIHSSYKTTKISQAYSIYARYLGLLKDASSEMLRKWALAESGNIRDVLVIARAAKGEAGLKPELHRIIQESSLPGLKAEALMTFATIATDGDLGFLKDVAANDPWYIEAFGDVYYRLQEMNLPTDKYYPLRNLAQSIIWRLAPSHPGQPSAAESGEPSLFEVIYPKR